MSAHCTMMIVFSTKWKEALKSSSMSCVSDRVVKHLIRHPRALAMNMMMESSPVWPCLKLSQIWGILLPKARPRALAACRKDSA